MFVGREKGESSATFQTFPVLLRFKVRHSEGARDGCGFLANQPDMGPIDESLGYEDIRKQRLEANEKRLQELGLANLSKSLKESITATKVNKARLPKQSEFAEVRRSSRVANGPQPDYREIIHDFPFFRRSYGRSSRLPKRYASDKARLKAAKEAEKLQEELPADNPSFVKLMLQSHVSGGFWLGLPLKFCRKHLPLKDETILLQDAEGGEWEAVYLAMRTGLSGGWRGFSIDHDLADGDAIVFELIQPKRFMVHIVRAPEDDKENDQPSAKKAKATKGGRKRKSSEEPQSGKTPSKAKKSEQTGGEKKSSKGKK